MARSPVHPRGAAVLRRSLLGLLLGLSWPSSASAQTAEVSASREPQSPAPPPEHQPGEALERSRRFGRWLLDHLITDMALTGAWRASFADDARAGFLAQTVGAELSLGLEFGDGYAVVGGARALAGTSNTTSSPESRAIYLETLGHLGFQFRVTSLLRLGVGASSGLLRRWPQLVAASGERSTGEAQDAVLVGGYLRAAVDFLPRPSAVVLRALSLFLRMDVNGAVADPTDSLPHTSLALSLGLGLRL